MEKATFAAGCFWGVEAAFRKINGVISATLGYTGGITKKPSYNDVCNGGTGHAEAVLLEFDPDIVSYEELLDAFWKMHDPTTPGRQGPDVGDQYRSAIFFHNPPQEAAEHSSKDKMYNLGFFGRPIVTEIVPASDFFPAEEYHQRYFEKRGGMGHC
jgi:peptide-methionine (S)-S-oxide reductase